MDRTGLLIAQSTYNQDNFSCYEANQNMSILCHLDLCMNEGKSGQQLKHCCCEEEVPLTMRIGITRAIS
eukprot:4508021-Ditylum_brightwellii.AAC.1